ncbi:MAG: YafY family protein [Clostridiales bacterium]|nr:YafY family protein [Clostridiales bacterium]
MKVDRLVSIIMILLDKKRIGAKELADMFEVSPRTIYRDIDSINMAGIPIRATSGVGGGFEIMPQYKVDNKVFSTSDLSTILMGLSSLPNMVQGNELVNALAKVKSFIPSEQSKDIELKANQIYIDLTPWMDNRNIQPYLEMIKSAMQENKLISFQYADRHGDKTVRSVEPYQLVLKDNHWYIQGYCRIRKDFRLFKLGRMSSLHICEEGFQPREYDRPMLKYGDIQESMQIKVKIRIHKSIMERVLDYCPYEDLVADGEEHYVVSFPFVETDYYYNILLGLGEKCECLEPERVRSEVKRRIGEMWRMYEG